MKTAWKILLLISVFAIGAFGSFAQTATPMPTPTPPVIDDGEILKIDTELVSLLFTAQDKDRRLLTSLKKEDIKILEDGQEQEIFTFQRQIDLPMSMAILIDVSGSQERTLPEEKAAAKSFVNRVVRPEKDEVSVVSFTGEATLELGLTSNIERIGRSIERIRFVPPAGYVGGGVVAGTPPIFGNNVAGSTAIWDAIWIVSDEVLGDSPTKTRRAIILLTDGYNTSGSKKLDDAVQAALKADATIYSIGIGDNFAYNGIDESVLRRVSERTGGRAFFPRDERDLQDAFTMIEAEMRSQYLLAYQPANPKKDGSYRKVDIQLVNSDLVQRKVKITHRQGYFAKTETAQPSK